MSEKDVDFRCPCPGIHDIRACESYLSNLKTPMVLDDFIKREIKIKEQELLSEELGVTEEEYNDIEISERKDREKLESEYQFY